MDKPVSLSVKDYLIRVLAVKMLTSEKTIEAIVNHQFQSANEALDTNKSVEISGFAKFIFNQKKSEKKLAAFLLNQEQLTKIVNDPSVTEHKRNVAAVKLEVITGCINVLKLKVHA
jgi:hypothetical protein